MKKDKVYQNVSKRNKVQQADQGLAWYAKLGGSVFIIDFQNQKYKSNIVRSGLNGVFVCSNVS